MLTRFDMKKINSWKLLIRKIIKDLVSKHSLIQNVVHILHLSVRLPRWLIVEEKLIICPLLHSVDKTPCPFVGFSFRPYYWLMSKQTFNVSFTFLQASWHQLKNLYPSLRGVQLHHLLANYDLGNRQVPAQWCPPSDEVHVIMDESKYGVSTCGLRKTLEYLTG